MLSALTCGVIPAAQRKGHDELDHAVNGGARDRAKSEGIRRRRSSGSTSSSTSGGDRARSQSWSSTTSLLSQREFHQLASDSNDYCKSNTRCECCSRTIDGWAVGVGFRWRAPRSLTQSNQLSSTCSPSVLVSGLKNLTFALRSAGLHGCRRCQRKPILCLFRYTNNLRALDRSLPHPSRSSNTRGSRILCCPRQERCSY